MAGLSGVEMEMLLALWNGVGAWLGLLIALVLFSLLVRDNRLARLAQYIFVGASLGYLAVVALLDVLWPHVTVGLSAGPGAVASWINLWLPLLLGGLMLVATVERMLAEPTDTLGSWRRVVRGAGALPAALLVGIGVAAGAVGVMQGTLWPQFLEVAQRAIPPQSAINPVALINGLLTLLISVATLLFWTARPLTQNSLLRAAGWVGQRAFWLAAGAIFARLVAARFDLFIGQVEYFRRQLETLGVW